MKYFALKSLVHINIEIVEKGTLEAFSHRYTIEWESNVIKFNHIISVVSMTHFSTLLIYMYHLHEISWHPWRKQMKICRKRNLQKSIQLNVLHAYSFLWLYCFFNLSEIHILLSNIWRIQRFFTMISHHYHLSSLSEHFFWRPNLWNAYHGIMYFIVCKCIAYVNAISFSWSLYLITQIVFIIQIHFLCIQNFHTYPSIKFVNSFDHGILMINRYS